MASEKVEALTSTEKDFLYSVLNLPNTASAQEIRDRYRASSIIFHPDKHHDEAAKEVAVKQFLTLQKAYEVLSDPFLRAVYDIFGEEGLHMQWAPRLRQLPDDELRTLLRRKHNEIIVTRREALVNPRGRFVWEVDVSSMFDEYLGLPTDPWYTRLKNRFEDVGTTAFSLRHSIQTAISEKTTFLAAAKFARRRRAAGGSLFGTIRHQYNPRWTFEATQGLFEKTTDLKATYSGDHGMVAFRVVPFPSLWYRRLPIINIGLTRRLFRNSLTQGSINFIAGPSYGISIDLVTPTPFNLTQEFYAPPPARGEDEDKLGSANGLGIGSRYNSFGVSIDPGSGPGIKAEWGVVFSEIATQARFGIGLSLAGVNWFLAGVWSNESTEVSTSLNASAAGVVLRVDLAYWEQQFSLPLTIYPEYDTDVAFWTAVVPTTAFVLGYQFYLKPRRRKRRAEIIQAAKRAADEDFLNVRREAEATTDMLRETARRHMNSERASNGLVITEASYGFVDGQDKLLIDVTIPLQALVHSRQLFIPSGQSKLGIPGFYDPAPSLPKTLRIRYLFRDREHYAEIPDKAAVVLPLQDHLVA